LESKSEEELRKISVELRLLEQTAETLQSRLNMINAVATDLTYASVTLETLDKEKENAELLVPIGGTSYIRARLDNPDKIIVRIGADVSVEKTRESKKGWETWRRQGCQCSSNSSKLRTRLTKTGKNLRH
jgi:prefoldin alpha subunit